jgi:PPK2 family polyphosphate:nucleotide phosphotransferase
MKTRRALKEMSRLAERYCVRNGRKFRLEDVDPADTSGVSSRSHAEKLLDKSTAILSEMQEKLYAQDRWALLLPFQGMDAAGKDSAIKHVMSGVNPQGCDVHSFKQPSSQELDHDFLWRTHTACPERGRIGIFNRSYYEEVVVTRVHPKLLDAERLPDPLVTKHIWEERFDDLNAHERYLARNGTVIRKFFLHLSKAEQRQRFLARLDEPAKNWKFSLGDVTERELWPDYQEAWPPRSSRRSTTWTSPSPRPTRGNGSNSRRCAPRCGTRRTEPGRDQALRKAWTARAVASGCSRWGAWPAPATTSSRVSGSRPANALA